MGAQDRLNILLVDDQPAKLLSYDVILRQLGENLIKAASAREALEHLLKNDIAIILIDVCMPDLDGFELAAMIRGHPRFQQTAIIFVSAIALTELDRLKGYEYGAVDYVSVPVVPQVLRAKVKVFTELYRKTRQLETVNDELERRVAERTAALERMNAELEQRVQERTREREQALAQVHEMQKLESLGQLTGGLAHDFNNLLTVILGNLDLLARQLPEQPKIRNLLERAVQSAERGAALTTRLLSFARRQQLKPETVELRGLIDNMAEMLQRTLGATIQIGIDFAERLPPIRIDPNQLELAVLNLALNARDAMPEGGRLTISAQPEKVDAPTRILKPGAYVRLAVTDTGTGMDEATLKRAPEPFFTTKGLGKGTGLGLSMIHGLAAQSGGEMRLSSRPGDGTTVELWLPAAGAASSDQVGSASPADTGRTRALRVLVVDDDPLVAATTVQMLEDLGHEARLVASGTLALDIVRSEAPLDLVLTDYAMPGMTGLDLVREIRRARSSLPVLLATGFADLSNAQDPTIPHLAKPYRRHDLAAAIANVSEPSADPKVIPIGRALRA